MRSKMMVAGALAVMFCGTSVLATGDNEQEIIDRYLKKTQTKHIHKISWISASFTVNRINQDNPYNGFANYTSGHFSNTDIPWLGQAKTFGLEGGLILGRNFAWSLGGEYWLKLGTNQTGSFNYTPPGGTPAVVTNLVSQVQVWGIFSSIQYYLYNPPSRTGLINKLAVRIGGSLGYYQASWDLFSEYQNLNLTTSAPTGINTTFQGTAPSFSAHCGIDYPLSFMDMAIGANVGYIYLNFTNVAWYNQSDEEVVATYDGTAGGRVDLDLSGFCGKVELKRFFTF
ncbi:MAG: hypothetical protein ABII79_14530 [bacterium]